MTSEPASRLLHDRLREIARCLGTADPTGDLAEAIDSGFERPLDDETYGDNALQPGALPFEWSFSEAACGALRVDFEPCGPGTAAIDRQAAAGRLVRNIIRHGGGVGELADFDRACAS